MTKVLFCALILTSLMIINVFKGVRSENGDVFTFQLV